MKRLRVCLILTLVTLLVTVSVSSASGNANPGVLPPSSRVKGLTYGEWSARYWQAFLAIPWSQNPVNPDADPPWTDCYFERIGNVGLAVSTAESAEISCEVPAGMPLFVPVVVSECSTLEAPPYYGGNEEGLAACALLYEPTNLHATVDGIALQDLSDYTVASPLFEFTLPVDNVFGLPPGTGQSVAYGTWLMLAPLSAGEHTISVGGTIPDVFTGALTYHITVTPGQ
jgi:hypothetical protein